jgi:ADP-heptose:LPS heptosyltransferase
MLLAKNWALYRAVAYLKGRGVTFGSAILPPGALNPDTYSVVVDLVKSPGASVMDQHLGVFARESLDHVFVGPRLESLDDPQELLKEAALRLKMGGHLVVHTLVGNVQPGMKEFYPQIIEGMVASIGRWVCKGRYEDGGQSLQIYKRIPGSRGVQELQRSGRKRVCVVRYGALGDGIIITPLLRHLAEEGYEVTLNLSTYALPIFENNPHIHNLIVQERDAIPNWELDQYWKVWEPAYDKYINLCESLEGDLLKVEGRKEFFTTKVWRNKVCAANYYDHALARAGYPTIQGKVGELYFTRAEERRAKEFFEPLKGKFVVLWALNGSSHHKIYPMMEATLMEWFKTNPQVMVITVGDQMARILEFDHPQLIPQCGQWSIRESLIATKYVDLVVGPETMVTNASGCFDTPKIILLSHSSRENLTKYFRNDYSLEPDEVMAPCYPCNQLHYTKESCPTGALVDTISGQELGQAPICSLAISPPRLIAQMDQVLKEKNERLSKLDSRLCQTANP